MHVRDCDWCGKTYVVKNIAEMGGYCSRKCENEEVEAKKKRWDSMTEAQKIAENERTKAENERARKQLKEWAEEEAKEREELERWKIDHGILTRGELKSMSFMSRLAAHIGGFFRALLGI